MNFNLINFLNLFDILYNTDLDNKSSFDISQNICFYYKLSRLIKFGLFLGSGLLWRAMKKRCGVADLIVKLICLLADHGAV